MSDTSSGRDGCTDQALAVPVEPFGLAASRIDPSRVLTAMQGYLDAAKAEGVYPVRWAVSDQLARQLSVGLARPAILLGLPVTIHDEWSWGWMLQCKQHLYDYDSHARFWQPACDSAGPQDIAQTQSEQLA